MLHFPQTDSRINSGNPFCSDEGTLHLVWWMWKQKVNYSLRISHSLSTMVRMQQPGLKLLPLLLRCLGLMAAGLLQNDPVLGPATFLLGQFPKLSNSLWSFGCLDIAWGTNQGLTTDWRQWVWAFSAKFRVWMKLRREGPSGPNPSLWAFACDVSSTRETPSTLSLTPPFIFLAYLSLKI